MFHRPRNLVGLVVSFGWASNNNAVDGIFGGRPVMQSASWTTVSESRETDTVGVRGSQLAFALFGLSDGWGSDANPYKESHLPNIGERYWWNNSTGVSVAQVIWSRDIEATLTEVWHKPAPWLGHVSNQYREEKKTKPCPRLVIGRIVCASSRLAELHLVPAW